MATLNNLGGYVQDRLEEPRGAGIFWSLQNEIYPLLVEACNEATLITGLPQIRSNPLFILPANTRIFSLPAGAIVLARMDGQKVIQKTSVWAMDQDDYSWKQDTGPVPLRWFPFGIGQFGIYPLLTANANVTLTTINLPVTVARPYAGTETVPFSKEYLEAMVDSAASVARLKEGGKDLMDGLKFYEMFLSKMVELSKFGDRISKLRFSRSTGIPAQVTDVETR